MKFDIITLFPEMFSAIKEEGVISRALKNSIISIREWQLRDFSRNRYKNVDDKPYGGGAGMVMQVQPIRDCLAKIKELEPETKVIYLSPQGEPLNQKLVEKFAEFDSLTLLCGRYEGIDERIRLHFADEEISIGDYILTGGEIPAMVLVEAVSRLIPGILGDSESIVEESFSDGMLEYPQYTRPRDYKGFKVPDVLVSGDPKKIRAWQKTEALKKTESVRPDLFEKNKRSS